MTDRVVVITGATGAAGRAAARAYAERGDALVLMGRDMDRLTELRRGLDTSDRCILLQDVDLTDPAAVKAAAQEVEARFGGAQVLIHLVGGWTGGQDLASTPPEDLDSMLSQHVHTTFNLFQAFAAQLEKSGWGRVLAISSPLAGSPAVKRGVYAAAKAAEETLFFTLGAELKDKGVTANVILVNAIDAGGTGKGTPLNEIVAAMLYLTSDEAARVNGARLPIA